MLVLLPLTDANGMSCGVYTYSNRTVSRQVLESVKEKLSALGVLPVRSKGNIALVGGAFSRVDDQEFDFEGMTPDAD